MCTTAARASVLTSTRLFLAPTHPQNQVLARDRLAGVLHRICETEYSNQVTLRYGVECEKVEWAEDGAAEATLTLRPNSCDTAALETARGPAAVGAAEDECPAAEESAAPLRVTTPFLVGADGAARAVAAAMESISEAEVKVRTTSLLATHFLGSAHLGLSWAQVTLQPSGSFTSFYLHQTAVG